MIEDQGTAIYGFFFKYLFYPDSAKINVVKKIFNVLFLVLKTSKRRK